MSNIINFSWQSHNSLLTNLICDDRNKNSYCDVTIICSGKQFPVHRLVLSSFSDCFKETLELATCRHPFIIVQDVSVEDMHALLNFMYSGEAAVPSHRVPSLLKAAKNLRIWGLSGSSESNLNSQPSDNNESSQVQDLINLNTRSKEEPYNAEQILVNKVQGNSKLSSKPNTNDKIDFIEESGSEYEAISPGRPASTSYAMSTEICNLNEKSSEVINNFRSSEGEPEGSKIINNLDNVNLRDTHISNGNVKDSIDNDPSKNEKIPISSEKEAIVNGNNSSEIKINSEILGSCSSSETTRKESVPLHHRDENFLSPQEKPKGNENATIVRKGQSTNTNENQNIPLIPVWCIKEEYDPDFDWDTVTNFENEVTSCSQPVITSVRSEKHDIKMEPPNDNLGTYLNDEDVNDGCSPTDKDCDAVCNNDDKNENEPQDENSSSATSNFSSEKNPNSKRGPKRMSTRRCSVKKPFKCTHCSYSAKFKQYLIVHLRTHTGEKPFKCTLCPYSSTQQSRLKVHLKTHDENWHKCEHCLFKTKDQKILQKHLKVHAYKTWITCHHCSLKTMSKKVMERHLRTTFGSSKFECVACKFETVVEDEYNEHIKFHKDQKLNIPDNHFLCPRCALKFDHKLEMVSHLKKCHSDDGQDYICNLCSFKTENMNYFLDHNCQGDLQVKTDIMYKCGSCDYETPIKYKLQNHRKIHTQKEYKCKECSFQAESKYAFSRHMNCHARVQRLMNSGKKLYKCKSCSFITSLSGSLETHCKIYHKNDFFKCNYCSYRGLSKSNVIKHMDIQCKKKPNLNEVKPLKPYTCELCSFRSETRSGVLKHKRIHKSDVQIKCNLCSYQTNNKEIFDQHSELHKSENQSSTNSKEQASDKIICS